MRDILDADYGDCSFDIIYSRNSILHIANKDELFAKLYVSLTLYSLSVFLCYLLAIAVIIKPNSVNNENKCDVSDKDNLYHYRRYNKNNNNF